MEHLTVANRLLKMAGFMKVILLTAKLKKRKKLTTELEVVYEGDFKQVASNKHTINPPDKEVFYQGKRKAPGFCIKNTIKKFVK